MDGERENNKVSDRIIKSQRLRGEKRQTETNHADRRTRKGKEKKKKKKSFIGARPFFMQHCNNPLI